MFDVAESRPAIIACHDEPATLDRVADRPGVFRARIAPGELWLIGPSKATDALIAVAIGSLRPASWGVVIDISDAWVAWTMSGCHREQAWARVSANPLPEKRPALIQGTVASLSTKTVVARSCLHVLAPSPLAHHLPLRLQSAALDLGPRLRAAVEFALELVTSPVEGAAATGAPSVVGAGAGR